MATGTIKIVAGLTRDHVLPLAATGKDCGKCPMR
jgi:hypothetical protein